MPPIISIIGNSKAGKTSLIEKLVPELKSRGYSVATIKHVPYSLTFDEMGKDSWRHAQAGSDAVAISSADKVVLIRPLTQEARLDELAHLFGEDYDIIITEGFKHDNAPKIEVHREETGPLLGDVRKLIAIVSDEPLETKVRQFSPQDIKGLADLIEKGFLEPQRERISLYVNDIPITLTSFPKEIIGRVLLAMASCLRGVKEISKLEIFLRKE
jgi:molybdopterin-guanine dinucleotide biosynthesis protein MobB